MLVPSEIVTTQEQENPSPTSTRSSFYNFMSPEEVKEEASIRSHEEPKESDHLSDQDHTRNPAPVPVKYDG